MSRALFHVIITILWCMSVIINWLVLANVKHEALRKYEFVACIVATMLCFADILIYMSLEG